MQELDTLTFNNEFSTREMIMQILPVLLCVLFVGLKLTGYIAWSWVWVTSPIWISFILAFLIIFFSLLSKEKKKVSRLR